MRKWKDISKDSWSFGEDMAYGDGGGLGSFLTSYAINVENGKILNGRVSADIKIVKSSLAGAGLVCRADELWTFLAMYVYKDDEKDYFVMRIGLWQESTKPAKVISKREKIYLDEGFNRFSLEFLAGNIKGIICTSTNTYVYEAIVPDLSFPGYVGLVKLYSSEVIAKNIKVEKDISQEKSLDMEKDKNDKSLVDMQNKQIQQEGKTVVSARQNVFISYNHQDKEWLDKLCKVLQPLVRNGTLKIWSDTQIEPGAERIDEINKALASAKVAVLLVTPNFLASDFLYKNELRPLLEAAESEGLTILWVAVSPGLYEATGITKYQAVNDTSQPLDSLSPAQLSRELVRIAKKIEERALL